MPGLPPTSARDDRWLGRGSACYGRCGGRRGFLGGGGRSVGEAEDRHSRQRSVGTHSYRNSSRGRQQSAVGRSVLALLTHLVAPRGLGRPEVHTIRGEGKRDTRVCVAPPVRRHTHHRPGKGDGGGGGD